MRALVLAFLIGIAIETRTYGGAFGKTIPNESETYQIIQGLLEGFPTEAHISEIKDCLYGADQISENFAQAVTSYRASTKESVIEALRYLGEAISQVPKFLECNPVERDLMKVYHSLNVFRNPLTFDFVGNKSIKVNEREIYWYLNEAIKFYEAKKWRDFGFYLGTCFGLVCGSGIQVIGY
ncbi:unnamed protein product [Blepharisma stoltei]|uniref:Uncharacterized protein n=1 Tax=Blepharisma stoltei TaxID=1481888 RepID=A0AAU9I653_9CILI|nr:unnamed protein product [Blepharisma stoltei]